jgi:hypothetical protein
MANDDKSLQDQDARLSFGVREIKVRSAQAAAAQALALADSPPRAANDTRGFDPYNTSGSFDRKKNWTRVGKR